MAAKQSATKSNKQYEIAFRKTEIAKLMKQGYYQYEIAEKLGYERSTITRDLRAMKDVWQKELMDEMTDIKVIELIKIREYEKECQDRLSRCKQATQGSRWMEELRKLMERRARLLGLDSPQKYETKRELSVVTKEDKDRMANAIMCSVLPENQIEHKPDEIVEAEFSEDLDEDFADLPDYASETDKILSEAVVVNDDE